MLRIFRYILIICQFTTAVSKGQVAPMLTRGPENGHLVIAGGNLRDTSVFNLFIRLAGGHEASVVIIPTAADDGFFEGDSALIMLERRYNRLGLQNITILHTRDPREADEKAFAEPITKARAVWFPGGRQWRLADSYLNTLTHRELNNLLSRGGVIGGSSAGATIQGSFLARGDTTYLMPADSKEFYFLRRGQRYDMRTRTVIR